MGVMTLLLCARDGSVSRLCAMRRGRARAWDKIRRDDAADKRHMSIRHHRTGNEHIADPEKSLTG